MATAGIHTTTTIGDTEITMPAGATPITTTVATDTTVTGMATIKVMETAGMMASTVIVAIDEIYTLAVETPPMKLVSSIRTIDPTVPTKRYKTRSVKDH
jgi:hypothetical protein